MYKGILLPLDGSKLAEESIPTAVNLAKLFGAKITLIQIYEVLALLQKDREIESKGTQDRAAQYLSQFKTKIQENGISAEVVIKAGMPDLDICKYAERSDVDLIILTSHGLGAFSRAALGSISNKVMRHSPKPVLLLRAYPTSLLKDKVVLVVDDEPDVLETVEDELDMCQIEKAADYDSAFQYLQNRTYDIVILDIMGVNGMELLKTSVSRGFPTVIFTAHALTPETLKSSIKLGAVFYLPKEKMPELRSILEAVVEGGGKPLWNRVFDRLASFFDKRFGPDWKKRDKFLEEFKESLKRNGKKNELRQGVEE